MTKRWFIPTVLLALVAVTPAAAAEQSHPCAKATARCDGAIDVPLDWSNPGSEQINMPFTWLPRTDQSRPAAGTIVALPGGPVATLGQLKAFTDTLGPALADYNVLLVERRGFGNAASLDCPDLDLSKPATISACATHLGPRIQYFSADQRVADIDAVRAALGVSKVTLYGVSYGTVEGAAYATRFPHHTAAAILDSPTLIPDRRTGYVTGVSFQGDIDASVRAFDSACNASFACRVLPGDTADRLAKVARTLREHPDPKVPLESLLGAVRFFDPVAPRDSNAAMQAYLNGDKAPLQRLMTLTGPGAGTPGVPRLPAGTLAYVCSDTTWPYSRDAAPEVRKVQLAEYRAAHPEHPITLLEATRGIGYFDDWCVNWPTPRPAPPVAHPYPHLPVLTIAGGFDSDAPEFAAELADRFHGRKMIVPFTGHATSLPRPNSSYQPCVAEAVRNFVAGRGVTGCSGENFRTLGAFAGGDLVTTTFRTAMDALAPRIPNTTNRLLSLTELPGLRGGKITFSAGKVTLDGVRFAADVAVSGEITLAGDQASAQLTANGTALRMTWKPFEAKDFYRVSGSRDGRPFSAWLALG